MTNGTISSISALAPSPGIGEAPNAVATDDSPRFRQLLESLERLAAEHRTAPPITSADDVPSAIARADQGFSLAMDLRQKLEEAFRLRMP